MKEILAKRTHVAVKVECNPPQATQSPKEKSGPLEWQKPVRTSAEGAGYRQTVCGRYSVSKDGNKTDGFSYTAWRRLPDTIRDGKAYKEMPVNLGCRNTKEEAEALCSEDLQHD